MAGLCQGIVNSANQEFHGASLTTTGGGIVDFSVRGPVLAVRPYSHTDHYWQGYFDTNRVVVETFGAAGYPVPEEHMHMSLSCKASHARHADLILFHE
jgi:hypothetical protein